MAAFRPTKAKFAWAAFQGRCRRRLLTGLLLMVMAIAYGSFAGHQFGRRGRDIAALDQPLVRMAVAMNPPPRHLSSIQPENNRELYLVTVISDQQDVMVGLTLLILRMILTLTVGGIGVVLVAGGSTEWEVRSEAVGATMNLPGV